MTATTVTNNGCSGPITVNRTINIAAPPCAECGEAPRVWKRPYCKPCNSAMAKANYDKHRIKRAEQIKNTTLRTVTG